MLFTNIVHTHCFKILICHMIDSHCRLGSSSQGICWQAYYKTANVSCNHTVELWLKIKYIRCLALRAHRRIICGLHTKRLPIPVQVSGFCYGSTSYELEMTLNFISMITACTVQATVCLKTHLFLQAYT